MDNFVERLDIFADTIYIEVSTERDVYKGTLSPIFKITLESQKYWLSFV